MRLANHLFYALAALIGVFLVALKDPSVALMMESGGAASAACRSDQLERPCNPGVAHDMLRGGQVTAR
jgi:hypothetical protein